jgi:hypothetical protein
MRSLNALPTPSRHPEHATDVDAFVGAVIRSHERAVRNLLRLAGGVAWPVDNDARSDRDILDSYAALYQRSA